MKNSSNKRQQDCPAAFCLPVEKICAPDMPVDKHGGGGYTGNVIQGVAVNHSLICPPAYKRWSHAVICDRSASREEIRTVRISLSSVPPPEAVTVES